MIALIHLGALAAYLGAWAVFLRAFREGSGPGESTGWKLALCAGGLHLLGLVLFSLAYGALPLVGLGPASSTLALAIAGLTLAASVREEARPTALFLLPLVLLLLAESVVVGVRPTALGSDVAGWWLWVHVGTVFLGYAGLALASAAAAMYVLQFRTLKRKRFGSVFNFFPALETLDRLNRLGLQVGFSALTVGILAGWSRTLTFGRGLDLGDPAVIFGVVTWIAFLVAIVARAWPGGRGARSAVATTAAFAVSSVLFGVLRIVSDSAGFFL